MPMTRRNLIAAAGIGAATMQSAPRLGWAQASNTIRIGVLNDQSGLYSHIGGVNGVAMAQAAAAEFNARGFTVEVLRADHQNKPDVGANIARRWIDREQVDVIVDVPVSSIAFAVQEIARDLEVSRQTVLPGAGPPPAAPGAALRWMKSYNLATDRSPVAMILTAPPEIQSPP